jgi:Fe-S cluster assembly iron-binding protein IscA
LLEITSSAAELIREMIDSVTGVEGIRVTHGSPSSTNGDIPNLTVVIAPAAGPLDEDQTLVKDGVAVFVDPDIAPLLVDKRLDVVPTGDDQVRFTLTEQEP